jgi:hypothetical protein
MARWLNLLGTLLLCGCVTVARVQVGGDISRPAGVSVSPVVVVSDLPYAGTAEAVAPDAIEAVVADGQDPPTVLDPVADGAFLRNDFVGNIRFGGGLIRTGSVALETRARLIELQKPAALRQQGVDWLDGPVTRFLGRAGNVARVAVPSAPSFRYQTARGTDEEDGHDNLNLPRTSLVPQPIAGAVGKVLVPYLRAYYTHNGGWFLGQRWGCMAGARVDVVLVLYDAGQPVWWVEAAGRSLDGATAQATTAELDEHLLDAEQQVEAALEKRLR